jgi:hypothetical protein
MVAQRGDETAVGRALVAADPDDPAGKKLHHLVEDVAVEGDRLIRG